MYGFSTHSDNDEGLTCYPTILSVCICDYIWGFFSFGRQWGICRGNIEFYELDDTMLGWC